MGNLARQFNMPLTWYCCRVIKKYIYHTTFWACLKHLLPGAKIKVERMCYGRHCTEVVKRKFFILEPGFPFLSDVHMPNPISKNFIHFLQGIILRPESNEKFP